MVCRFLCSVVGGDDDTQCSVNGYVCLSFLVAQLPLVWVLYKLLMAVWARFRPKIDLRRLYQPGSWVVVTGATAGIGLAFAFRFAELGFNLVLIARDEAKLERVKAYLTYKNPAIRVHTIQADFSRPSRTMLGGRVFCIYTAIQNHLETLDIAVLVNNVGMCTDITTSHKLSTARMNELIAVNIESQLKMSKIVGAKMVRQGHRAAIINVSSHSGVLPAPLLAAYSASKAFNRFYSLATSQEYRDLGIQVLCVSPAFVDTQLQGWIAETMAPTDPPKDAPAPGTAGSSFQDSATESRGEDGDLDEGASPQPPHGSDRRGHKAKQRFLRWPRITPIQVVDGSLAELGRGTRETSGTRWHKVMLGALRLVPNWIYLEAAMDYLIGVRERYARRLLHRVPVRTNPTEDQLRHYEAEQRRRRRASLAKTAGTGGGGRLWDEDDDDEEEAEAGELGSAGGSGRSLGGTAANQGLMGDFQFDSAALLLTGKDSASDDYFGAEAAEAGFGEEAEEEAKGSPRTPESSSSSTVQSAAAVHLDMATAAPRRTGASSLDHPIINIDDVDSIEMRFRENRL